MPEDLVGTAEIAALLQLSRQRVHRLVERDDLFCNPIAEISAGRIWKRLHVEMSAKRTGRIA